MGSSREKSSSDDSWVKWASVVIGLLTVLLNFQTFHSNEKLREIQNSQEAQREDQRQALEQQKLLLEQQSVTFDSHFKLFDLAIQAVERNNAKHLKILLALVQSFPKNDYSNTLLTILAESSNPDIQEQAINTIIKTQLGEENAEWVYRPYSKETSKFTDYQIFTCNSASSDLTTEKLLISTLQVFNKAPRIGSIRVKKWKNTSEFPLQELERKTTVITDKNHPEKKDAEVITSRIEAEVKDIPLVKYQDNRGNSTPWQVNIILCP